MYLDWVYAGSIGRGDSGHLNRSLIATVDSGGTAELYSAWRAAHVRTIVGPWVNVAWPKLDLREQGRLAKLVLEELC